MKMKGKIFVYYILLLIIVVSFSLFFTIRFQKRQMLIENVKFHQTHFDESAERTQIVLIELTNVIESVSESEETLNYHVNDNPDAARSLDDVEIIRDKQEYLSGIIKDYTDVDSILLFQDNYAFFGYNTNRAEVDSPDTEGIREIVKQGRKTGIMFDGCCLCRTEIYDEDQLVLFRQIDEDMYIFVVLSSKFGNRINFPGDETYITDGSSVVRLLGSQEYESEEILNLVKSAETGNNIKTGSNTISLFTEMDRLLNLSVVSTIDVSDSIIKLERENTKRLWIPIASIVLSLVCVYLFSRELLERIYKLKKNVSREIPEKISSLKITSRHKRKLLPRIPIRVSVFLLFFVTILLPIVSITVVSHGSFVQVIESSLGNIVDNDLSRVSYNLNFLLESYTKTILGISTDSQLLSSFEEYYSGDDRRTYETRQKEMTGFIFDRLFYREGIINISLYDNDRNLFYSYLQDGSGTSESVINEDIQAVLEEDPIKLWKGPYLDYFGNKYFRIGMRLRRPDDARPLGFLFLDVSLDGIVNIVGNTITSEDTYFSLLSESGDEIVNIHSNVLNDENTQTMFEAARPEFGRHNSYRIMNYYLNAYSLRVNGWRALCAVAIDNYVNDYSRIVNWNLLLLVLYLGLSLIFSLGFSISLTRNLKLVEKELLNLRPNDIRRIKFANSSDEIEELGEAFNMLIERIDVLINEVYEERLEKSRIELKLKESQYDLLQSQINPHFLYNTLETIHFMIRQNDPRSVKMVQMLGLLFRMGIGNGEKYVTLENELEYVKIYMQLQQIHFSDRLEVKYIIPESLKGLYVLRFILQPIVENSLLHGLEEVETGGLIEVLVSAEGGKLEIDVRDNGIGMDSDTLESIREQFAGKKKKRSIGLMNVYERIKLEYGGEYGIEITSEPNKGTQVKVILPVLEENPGDSLMYNNI